MIVRPTLDHYQSLYEVAKQLVLEKDPDKTAEVLFRKILSIADADRGFIVVRDGGSFEQKWDFRFDRANVSAEDRRFSRTLVREVLASRKLLHFEEGSVLPSGGQPTAKSVFQIGAAATLVVPLLDTTAGDGSAEVLAVIYLDRARGRGGFESGVPAKISEIAEIAAAFIQGALERKNLTERARTLEKDLLSQHNFEGIVTREPTMLTLLGTVAQVADSHCTVLVRGETGTGKELIARALHVNSPRRNKPLVTLHCTALPTAILESELFGHVRGAFTGADKDRVGRVASAHGGTLFLDEVAEIPPEAQAKLLRFLQFGEIQRIGSDRVEKVDVRVISATHQDLEGLVRKGTFRQDLYYRLNVVEVELPPLRDRRGDIAPLLSTFLKRFAKSPQNVPRFSGEALRALEAYSFPGNVRELQHIVERACVLARGQEITLLELPKELRSQARSSERAEGPTFMELSGEALNNARDEAVARIEREFLSALLREHKGNVALAAREAQMHRSYLQKLLSKHPEVLK